MTSRRPSPSSSRLESRRKLLKFGACGAMTSISYLSTLLHLKLTGTVMAAPTVQPTGGYKALVCLFLDGGADSFNFLTPFGTSQGDQEFTNYTLTRSGAALRRSPEWDGAWDYGYLQPIIDSPSLGGTGRTFGLHPRFTYLKQIYEAGRATFVANAGPLVQPIANAGEYNAATKIKPLGLFSHPDQSLHWQSAVPTSRQQLKGWAGKMADLLTDSSSTAAASNVYAAISTEGQSQLLTGNRTFPYAITPSGAVVLNGIGNNNPIDRVYSTLHANLASQTYADLLEKSIRDGRVVSRDAAAAFQQAFSSVVLPSTSVPFPNTTLGQSLAAVAKCIKVAQSANSPLRQERQIFMVPYRGWDHHASVINAMNGAVADVDTGLKALHDFLVAENLINRVTTFTISDFGRTLSFNGSGTDHAWGGNPLVMGGAVNATPGNNRIWGSYPNMPISDTDLGGLDLGRGTIIPQTSADAYLAEICRWFGIGNDSNLELILPNIRNFYSAGASGHPVGFLNF